MILISKKQRIRFSLWLIISGIGALWLTYWFNKAASGDSWISFDFGVFPVLYYYIFNSSLLVLLSILLYFNFFYLYSRLSILLGISVTISLFIINDWSQFFFAGNLFISTTFLGMFAGFMYGGTILVPLFLGCVYKSTIYSIKYIKGTLSIEDDH